MRVYFGFNLQTQTVLCHEIAKNILTDQPDSSFAGVMSVKGGVHEEFLRAQDDIVYDFLDTTDEIEKKALTYEVPAERLLEWERRLKRPLMDLVVADRDIGHRYVRGGNLMRTDLMDYDSQEDLKKFVCCFLDIFEERLTRFKPDVVFFPAVASLPYLALARICLYMDIPFFKLKNTRIGNRFILALNDDTERFYQVEKIFRENCVSKERVPELPPEFANYLESYRTESPERPEWALSCNKRIEKIQNRNFVLFYGELILRFGLACKRWLFPPKNRDLRWKKPFSIFCFQLAHRVAVRWFDPQKWDMPRDKEPFVYFPLHLNPEASTMILAPGFVDQALTVDLLAKNIPLTHKLYVKEHPMMIGRRPKEFYLHILKNVNVRLINPLVDSMELARQADLVTVITGTAGWEAVLMGRQVLTLGESFFSHLGFSHHCTDIDQLGPFIKRIILDGEKPYRQPEDLVRWLYCLSRISFDLPDGFNILWGTVDPYCLTEKQKTVARILAEQLMAAAQEDDSYDG